MPPIPIKVSLLDFKKAREGYVDGLYRGKKGIYTYVELGHQVYYTPRYTDDKNTQFKRFRNCNLYLTSRKEDIKEGKYQVHLLNRDVIIYC